MSTAFPLRTRYFQKKKPPPPFPAFRLIPRKKEGKKAREDLERAMTDWKRGRISEGELSSCFHFSRRREKVAVILRQFNISGNLDWVFSGSTVKGYMMNWQGGTMARGGGYIWERICGSFFSAFNNRLSGRIQSPHYKGRRGRGDLGKSESHAGKNPDICF